MQAAQKGGQALDKRGEFKTITIKINGSDRLHQEKKVDLEIDEEAVPSIRKEDIKEKIDVSLNDIESGAREQSAVAQEAEDDDSFEWILPEKDGVEPLEEFKIIDSRKKPTEKSSKTPEKIPKVSNGSIGKWRNKGIFPSVLITIFLAVVIGTTFGVVLLKMVISETAIETGGEVVGLEETPTAQEEKENVPNGTATEIPAITGFVIQGGAFSTKEAAQTEEANMAQKGTAAKVMEVQGKFYIFIGVSDTLANAKAIGAQLKNSGIENFAKEVAFGGKENIALSASETTLLQQASTLFKQLSAAGTSVALQKAVSPELVQSITKQTEEWNKIDAKTIENKQIQQMKVELDGAIEGVKKIGGNSNATANDGIQQHLLNFLALYHTL